MGLTPAAREELEATCKKVFNEFDADHGGTVDTDEIKAHLEQQPDEIAEHDRTECRGRQDVSEG